MEIITCFSEACSICGISESYYVINCNTLLVIVNSIGTSVAGLSFQTYE